MSYRYWMSYDLGFMGDYEELYEWLDEKDSKECGDSVATFMSEKSPSVIEEELKKLLENDGRVYLIGRLNGDKITGRFIIGKRKKKAPWSGYAEHVDDEVEDEA